MANVNAPFGFKPFRTLSGNGNYNLSDSYSIDKDYATALYHGDPVKLSGTGKNIILCPAADPACIGIFGGVYLPTTEIWNQPRFSRYWPGAQAKHGKVMVYDDPNLLFEIQCTTLAAADIDKLANWTIVAGSTITGNSATVLDGTTTGTTGAQLRIVELANYPDNAYGAYARAVVQIVRA